MKKINSTLKMWTDWIVFNSVFLALLYMAAVGHAWAGNLVKFLSFLFAALCTVCLGVFLLVEFAVVVDEKIQEHDPEDIAEVMGKDYKPFDLPAVAGALGTRPIPRWLDVMVSAAIVGAMVATGFLWSGAAYMWHAVAVWGCRASAGRLKRKHERRIEVALGVKL